MIDPATITQLANLRNRIEQAQIACAQTLKTVSSAGENTRMLAATTPFLADCAEELEALAGVCRQAAAAADHAARPG